jgi:hypothetical protein
MIASLQSSSRQHPPPGGAVHSINTAFDLKRGVALERREAHLSD